MIVGLRGGRHAGVRAALAPPPAAGRSRGAANEGRVTGSAATSRRRGRKTTAPEPARPRAAGSGSKRRRRRLRLIPPLLVLGVVAFLYYKPLARYVDARSELASRRAEVAELRVEKARLERRLERSTSLVALAREARGVGLVRPGEQLFIVKGISAWRRSHADRTR
jgi:hypothetical protein